MKKISLFLFSLIILTSFVFATTSIEKGTDWLVNNADWDEDIEPVAFSILSLDLAGRSTEAEEGLEELLDRKNPADCWPKGTCRVKDTALALLVLNNFNKPTSDVLEWLEDSQIPALKTGTFWIQIATNTDGDCVLDYGGKQPKTFTIQDDKILKYNPDKPWIDVNDIEKKFVLNSLSREVDVDCSSLPGGVIISLIYQIEDSYYLLQEEHSNNAVIQINNACFGSTSASNSCDYRSTAFASWVLSLLDEDLNTLSYLNSKISDGDILSHALLYLITKKNVYSNWLKEHQTASGNFGDIYTTSFANLALEGSDFAGNSTDWLKMRQKLDGSWNDDMLDTSVVLYSLLGGIEGRPVIVEGCTDRGYNCCDSCVEGFEQTIYDDTCYAGEFCCDKCESVVIEETCISQGYRCCDACDEDFESYLIYDDTCDYGEICCEGCEYVDEEEEEERIEVSTSDCGDGECGLDEDKESCPEDCKGFPIWIIVILIIILLVVGFLLVYKKFFKGELPKLPEILDFFKKIFKKGKSAIRQPSRIPQQRPAYPARKPPLITRRRREPAVRSRVDKELEKSLAEARKLLGKRKK